MIALDTNVLVRLLVADEPKQTAEVRRMLRRVQEERAQVLILTVVVCETAWVLRSVYRLDREEVADALETVLEGDLVVLQDAGAVSRALRAFRSGRVDLSDYVVREASFDGGAQAVATFDARALKEPGFVRPEPRRWPRDLEVREDVPPYRRRAVSVVSS